MPGTFLLRGVRYSHIRLPVLAQSNPNGMDSAHASTLEPVIVDEFVKTNVYEGDVSTDIQSAD
jgi:hypothetical protein